ncbi:beta-lactamase family protein [Leucobacter allii]|uniref:serine hydrolase domain-containing protein n=1 Tax=Leucobacter allii TaxID=2932247 RepID=UPI001FD482A3|nr:serine hydrolase domain-containing protein [Leucobacter allii]UOR02090.1 beta-lactamase family protein [Leucobacter allii]
MALVAAAAIGLTACSGGGVLSSGGDVNTVDGALSSSIDDAIASAMQQSGSTEAVVGVWSADGEYVTGYGDGIDGSARIRGAQATQPVMCALLLDLVEEGRLDLDREITEDLTRQSGVDGVTYRQLCDMTSGIRDFKGAYTDIFANNPSRPWPEQELIAQGLSDGPFRWRGLNMHQSDTNAVLLARVLKVETATDISSLLRDRIFSPAGMGSSYYPDMSTTTVSGTTLNGLTYPSSGGAPICDVEPVAVAEVSPSMLGGAGATVTTVTDLKNFYTAYLDGAFGGEDASVVTTGIPTKNPDRDQDGNPTTEPDTAGRQWTFGMEKVGPLYGRTGSITGTLTAAYHDPESGYTVVVALNNSSAGAGFAKSLAFEIAAISAEAGSGPELAWTAEDQRGALAKAAVCQ